MRRPAAAERTFMNCIIISPNFPANYRFFCDRLKRNGVNVLGIGDAPYDELDDMLKSSLTEYYKVSTLEDYDQVFRAVAYLAFRHGKPDWIESNNEYWLKLDAQLRKDFNVTTGVMPEQLSSWQSKSSMKPVYRAAGIPSAREHLVTDREAALSFIDSIGGYPVFAKPDTGVGASDTFRINNDEELSAFFETKPDAQYIMEEFVFGDIYSFDAVCDGNGEVLFESSFMCPNVAETVNDDQEMMYYVLPHVPSQLSDYGRRAIKAFNVTNRFIHFEFFRLRKDKKGLGKAGDFVGLEVNMRPAGGYTPDLINYAHSIDVYQLWADLVTYGSRVIPETSPDRYCVFAGRKDSHPHTISDQDILNKYGDVLMMHGRMPDALSLAMGNHMYVAVFDDFADVLEFGDYILEGNVPDFVRHYAAIAEK